MEKSTNLWLDVLAIVVAGGVFGEGLHLFMADWCALGATVAVAGLFMMRNVLT